VNPPLPSSETESARPTASGRLIVCEREGRWAVALRRELVESGVRVWETRSLADCWEMLSGAAASFLVIELTKGNADAVVRRLLRLPREFPQARAAAVGARGLVGYSCLLREAGAVEFVASPRRLGLLSRMACRHLASVPPPSQSLAQRIWAGLPWTRE
jgi:hypothetical protein